MANFLDNFSGSGALSGHTADSGQGWLFNSDITQSFTTASGECYATGANANLDRAVANYTPGNDQRVRIVLKKYTITTASSVAGLLRVTNESGAAANGNLYYFNLLTTAIGTQQMSFWSHTSGDAWAQLGTATTGLSAVDGTVLDFTVTGSSSPVLKGYIDAVLQKTETDSGTVATAGKAGLYADGQSASNDTHFGRVQVGTLGVAFTYTLSLTGGGATGAPVTCTVTPEVFDGTPQTINGTVTINFSGVSGVPANHVFTFSNSSAAQTFDVTPTGTGTLIASGANDQYMVDPGNATKTIVAGAVNATLSGPSPSGAVVGQPSNDFTVTLDDVAPTGGIACTVTSSAGATITPSTPTVAEGDTTVTFTVTPAAAGDDTITLVSITGGGTISGSPITLTAVIGQYADASAKFAASATVGYRVDRITNGARVNYWPRTTSGVVEVAAGGGNSNYLASFPLAAPGGYIVDMDDGTTHEAIPLNLSGGGIATVDAAQIRAAVYNANRADYNLPGTFGEGQNVYSEGGRVVRLYDGQFAAVGGGTVTLPVSRTDGQAFGTNGEYANKQLWIVGGTGRDGTVYLTTWVSGRQYTVGAGSVTVDTSSQFTVGPDTVVTTGTITSAASVAGAVGSVTAAVTLPSIPSNWITAAGIGAAALAGKGDWITTLGSNAPSGWINAAAIAGGALSGKGDWPSAATIAAATVDLGTSGHTTSGSFGAAIVAAGSAGDPWSTVLPGSYGANTAGQIIGQRLDAAVSSRLSTLGSNAPSGWINAAAIAASALNGKGDWPGATTIAAATMDLATVGHTTAGSFGAAIAAAGTAADPWSVSLPGAYGAGTAGKLVGQYLDAAVSSRSTFAGGAVASVTAPVSLDLSQALSTSPATGTTGHALAAALGSAVGKVTQSGLTLTVYLWNNTTVLRTFALDDPDWPTSRT